MWNDLQTDKEEGQEEELHVTDNNKIGKSKQSLLFSGPFSQLDCSGHPSA